MDILLLYALCAGAGLLFLIGTAVFGELFGHDVDVAGADVPGAGVLSPLTIATFVTAFGGLGLVFHHISATSAPAVSAALSVFGAAGLAALLVTCLRFIFNRTQSSSESHVATLSGLSASVITPIPENGVGEIAYVQGGTRYSAPAREEKGRLVNNGQTVKITRVVGTQFFVQLENSDGDLKINPTNPHAT